MSLDPSELGSTPKWPNKFPRTLVVASGHGSAAYLLIGRICDILSTRRERYSLITFHFGDDELISPERMIRFLQTSEASSDPRRIYIIPDCATRAQFDALAHAHRIFVESKHDYFARRYKCASAEMFALAKAGSFDMVFDLDKLKDEVVAREIVERWFR